jgi:hypothetical protein
MTNRIPIKIAFNISVKCADIRSNNQRLIHEQILAKHRYWTWKVRHGRSGRPRVPKETRDLIRIMSRENPLWGAPRSRVEHWRGDPKEAPCLCPAFPPSCPFRSFRNPVSSARHVARSRRISRTTRSCTLHIKGYETYRTGTAFDRGRTR